MIRKKDDGVYAGGSKWFDESTGTYRPGFPGGTKPGGPKPIPLPGKPKPEPIKPGKPKPKPEPIKPGKPKPPVKPIGPKPTPEKPGKPLGDYLLLAKRMNDPNGFYYN